MRVKSCLWPLGVGRLAVVVGIVCGLAGFAGVPSALALTSPALYWSNFSSDTIGTANLDGTNVNESFVTSPSSAIGVAVDGQHLYWSSYASDSILRANLDGSDIEPGFITGAGTPIGIAVNSTHVYWANDATNTIGEANLDGTGVNPSFITGANEPGAVALDGQHIYWTNYGAGTIGEANLDGTDVDQSLVNDPDGPFGIALDGQHIYWTNLANNTIGEANLDGSNVNESFIATSAANVQMLATDGQRLYWADMEPGFSGNIGDANVDGTNVNPDLITGASSPLGVAVSVPSMQVSPASPPAFGTTPQGTVSSALVLTVSNAGQNDLSISGLSFTGADPGDYIVSSNSCPASIAPGGNCQINVSFAPQGLGTRTATLQIVSNDYANSPLQVPLSGTGGPAGGPTVLAAALVTASGEKGPGTALAAKATAIQTAVGASETAVACAGISNYLGLVNAQTGKTLTTSPNGGTSAQLTTDANNLAVALGC